MSPHRVVINRRTGKVVLARARYCAGFTCRLIGLQFKGRTAAHEGAIYVSRFPSRLVAIVHTMCIRFDIGVVWLDSDLIVVDKKLAKPWRFAHVPKARAMYYLEADPSILERVQIGDQLQFKGVVA
jgi:uncharacterized membrane protein (UPF0127 family)